MYRHIYIYIYIYIYPPAPLWGHQAVRPLVKAFMFVCHCIQVLQTVLLSIPREFPGTRKRPFTTTLARPFARRGFSSYFLKKVLK